MIDSPTQNPRGVGDNSWLGSMNCYVATVARYGCSEFVFNGTTLDLTKRAVAHGVPVGGIITADGYQYELKSAPHDARAGGFWAAQVAQT